MKLIINDFPIHASKDLLKRFKPIPEKYRPGVSVLYRGNSGFIIQRGLRRVKVFWDGSGKAQWVKPDPLTIFYPQLTLPF